jgi:DNA integrity scanning protein DisA with diadenylate cyclase activity
MYVSYAMTTAWAISNFFVIYFLLNLSLWFYLPYLVITLILLNPIIFRISRSIYLSFFVYFDPNWKNNILEKTKKDYH